MLLHKEDCSPPKEILWEDSSTTAVGLQSSHGSTEVQLRWYCRRFVEEQAAVSLLSVAQNHSVVTEIVMEIRPDMDI